MVVGLVHSTVHHHGRGGGRMVSASPTCPREQESLGGGVRKSRTFEEKNPPITSSTLFPRTSTMTMAPSTRTTASRLRGIASGPAAARDMIDEDNSSNKSVKKLRKSRRNKQLLSSQYSRRLSKTEASSRAQAHITSTGNDDLKDPTSPPHHPFDEDASTLLKTSAACTTTSSSPPGPGQGDDFMNMAYSYSLLEEDGGADANVVAEYASDEEDDYDNENDGIEITSPPRLLVSSLARSSSSGAPLFITTSSHHSHYSAAQQLQQAPNNSGLSKEDVQELVRAIHDISDCVNSLKNAVLPEAQQIMKEVDTSLRGSSSSSHGGRGGADRRDRGDHASASSLSSSSILHEAWMATTIHGMNPHENETRQSCSLSSSSHTNGSSSNSNNSNSTVVMPPTSSSSSSRRSLPEFFMPPEETSARGSLSTGTRRRLRSLSNMTKSGAVGVGKSCRRTASLVATLSKASASAELLAKTIQKQFNSSNGNSDKSNNQESPLGQEHPELQRGDEDSVPIPYNEEEDELELWQEPMPAMNKPEGQHDEKARTNGTAADSTSAGSSSPIDDSLHRINGLLLENFGKIANNVNTRAASNGRQGHEQQPQQQDAGSGSSSSGRGGMMYHSFRPDGDERSHGRRGGGMSSYYGMGSSSGKRTPPVMPCSSTSCLPMSNLYTDYVESFTNLKEQCSAATGVNIDFPWEGTPACDLRPTTSNTGRNPSGRGGGGRRGFVSNHHHHHPNPVSQCSSYSDEGQEHWLQYKFGHDDHDEYGDEDEEDDINLFGHGYYITKAPMQRSSSLYPTHTAATSCRRTPKATMNSTSFRLQSPPTNLGRVPTRQEEHDDDDDDDDGIDDDEQWLSSGRRGLDPAVILQETLDNYHHSSATSSSAPSSTQVHHV